MIHSSHRPFTTRLYIELGIKRSKIIKLAVELFLQSFREGRFIRNVCSGLVGLDGLWLVGFGGLDELGGGLMVSYSLLSLLAIWHLLYFNESTNQF